MLCHRQVHTEGQGRWQEAHPQAHHRPGRTGLPRPQHVPVKDPSRHPCKMSGWLDPHLLCGSQPQYALLRASMLAYAHINLLDVLRRFTPTEAIRVVTDSLYVKKTALHKLEGIVAYVPHDQHPKGYCTTCLGWHDGPTSRPPNKENVAPAQWRDKGETIYSAQDHAAYEPEPEHWGASNDVRESTAPSHADPLTHHVLSYLNGGGGSNKTTRTIDLFWTRNPLLFTPTHRLAKEMRTRGVKAQTYHSFFRWSGQTEWTPDRMGQKYILRVIIWDEVCTVPKPMLETFLDWLDQRGVQVIYCGDQGQPPPIAGESQHDWLRERVDYYEEMTVDYRSKCDDLRALQKAIRLQPDKVQCREMRKALPQCLGWDRFVNEWQPHDIILVSSKAPCDRGDEDPGVKAQTYHFFFRWSGMLLGNGQPDQQELVLNDVVEVSTWDGGGGPWRQVGPRLGSWLRYDGAQQPGPDHQQPTEGIDHRRLPPVEQPELPGCLPGGLPPPDCEVLSSARCRWSTPTTLRRCHSKEKHWPQAPVIQVRWCCKGPWEQPAYEGLCCPQRET